MKKFHLLVLFLALILAPSFVTAQSDTSVFDKKVAWSSPAPNTPIEIGRIISNLSNEHGFYWQLTPGTSTRVLESTIAGNMSEQPLRSLIAKILAKIDLPVKFDGKLVIIGKPQDGEIKPTPSVPQASTSGPKPESFPSWNEPNTDDNEMSEADEGAYGERMMPDLAGINPPQPRIVRLPFRQAQGFPNGRWTTHHYGKLPNGYGGYLYTQIGTMDARYYGPAVNYGGNGYNNYPAGYSGAYGYAGGNADQAFRHYFRDPRRLETHGLIKISGPEYYLDKVRIQVDGADVAVASDVNNWNEQPIVLRAGVHTITLIREEEGKIFRFSRRVRVSAAAEQLSLTGKIKPFDIKVTKNEFENAEGTTLTPTEPVR